MLGILLAGAAMAHDSAEPFAPWYNSLMQNGTNVSCCDQHDCGPVDYKIEGDGYKAKVGGVWIPIPAEKVLKRDNPTGMAVLCHSPTSGIIYCFVPSSET